jgi:cytoskeletal protein CcmA (bactofilin family)
METAPSLLPTNGLGQTIERGAPILPSVGWSAALLRQLDLERFTRLTHHLSPRDQQHLFGRTLAGKRGFPHCPSCRVPLRLELDPAPGGQLVTATLETRGEQRFDSPVYCRKLVVHRGAKTRFAAPVFTDQLVVNGEVSGHITCAGHASVAATAAVNGHLAARSLSLRPGGALGGTFQIIDTGSRVPPPLPVNTTLTWTCPNAPTCPVSVPAHPGLSHLARASGSRP